MAGFGSPEQETLGQGGDAGEAAAHLSASEFKARVEARKEKLQPGTAVFESARPSSKSVS
jgi:hypothetical protein